jgi:UDP:flavonoid glycosyltransferase YjiC (YdhE family)
VRVAQPRRGTDNLGGAVAVILAYGSPALGHLYPLGALLVELVARGHQVHLRTMAGQVATMRDNGVHTDSIDPRIESIVGHDWLARGALDVLKRSVDVLCRRAVFEVDDLRRAIAQVQPDVPVCVVPYARDQAEVARRVQVAGCGTRLPSQRLSPARLREAVQSLPASPRPVVWRVGPN